MNDDVWVYTGVTSVSGDRSNVGFVLMNQRTKETKYYEVSGAEEYSAMGSAEGQVQNLGYKATFPLLLNIANEPTYFIALKDEAGLVKKYAMVNIQKYQNVAIGCLLYTSLRSPKRVTSLILVSGNLNPQGMKKGFYLRTKLMYWLYEKIGKINQRACLKWQLYGLMACHPHINERELSRLKVPVLIIAGEKDLIKENHTRHIHNLIPNSDLVLVPGAGHMGCLLYTS